MSPAVMVMLISELKCIFSLLPQRLQSTPSLSQRWALLQTLRNSVSTSSGDITKRCSGACCLCPVAPITINLYAFATGQMWQTVSCLVPLWLGSLHVCPVVPHCGWVVCMCALLYPTVVG
ncbi:hypothetical protein ANANG_G00007990 [Anguilla anguilla]|uniref:Secreted protein n=1 Tax=Anguilla anguilla TaxID=7936 RepID=A0A9D3MWM9_ANGAN|nr:hypothetical protein ANANG_G00007990 [Anguilla anguilla]